MVQMAVWPEGDFRSRKKTSKGTQVKRGRLEWSCSEWSRLEWCLLIMSTLSIEFSSHFRFSTSSFCSTAEAISGTILPTLPWCLNKYRKYSMGSNFAEMTHIAFLCRFGKTRKKKLRQTPRRQLGENEKQKFANHNFIWKIGFRRDG